MDNTEPQPNHLHRIVLDVEIDEAESNDLQHDKIQINTSFKLSMEEIKSVNDSFDFQPENFTFSHSSKKVKALSEDQIIQRIKRNRSFTECVEEGRISKDTFRLGVQIFNT